MAAKMQKPPKGIRPDGGVISALFEIALSYPPPQGRRQMIKISCFETRGSSIESRTSSLEDGLEMEIKLISD
jgi:hypothetical protein